MYLNPDVTDEGVKRAVIDQWHLYLALNPVATEGRYSVADKAVKAEPRRVTYFRTWLQAEGLL